MGKALITGGAGFIGSHVVDAFLERGFDVAVIDNLSSGKRENLDARASLHEIDVRSDAAAALVRAARPDVVVHLAAQIDVRRSVADPVYDASVNILGSLNLLEAIRSERLATRFVFASTGGAIYGDFVKPPNIETFPKDPESPYAISKLSAEYYMAYYARLHGLNTVALRFSNVFGPRQDPHGEAGVVAIFCGRLLREEPLTVFGDGLQTRDYVFVGDVAAAVVAATMADLPAPTKLDERAFNIGTGTATTVLRLADLLRGAAKRDVPVVHAAARTGEQMHSFLDNAKARAGLGWQPSVSLAEGLARTYRWFAERVSPRIET